MLISVKSSGMVHWEPGIITETSCAVNIGKYPFDTQVCDIRFLTWMHTNKTLTVGPEIDKINMDALLPNGEWDITRTEAKEYRYPSTYRMGTDHTGVTFVVHLRRKRFFYVLNTIIPVVMLSCLNVLVFILPSDCGERMALAVTVLLAFTVYLGIISDNIPKTSESLSLLAIYLTSLLALSTASVVCAGIVLNIHYRDPSHPVPRLLKLIFSGIGVWTSSGLPSSKKSVSSNDSRRRENRRTTDSFYDERDENDHGSEKVYISTCGSPGRRRSSPTSLPHQESIRMRSSNSSDNSNSPVGDAEEFENSGEESHQILETTEMLAGSPPLLSASIAHDSSGNHVDMNDTHPSRNPRLAVKQYPPSHNNHQCFRFNYALKKKKFFYNEDSPSVCGNAREVKFSESRAGTGKRTSQPDNVRDREYNIVFENNKRQMRKASVVSHTSSAPDKNGEEKLRCQVQNNCSGNRYSSVPSEVHHLLHDSTSGGKNEANQSGDRPEVTWHDIGNSLDRSLFWIFFLFTNTVTVIILVLFVRDD
ncbi:neuronal acetylcholine receptor subunit alpha-7 [Elysia marginata]|uniref:Neuronal acetylcholine receptor subunit alpha-7 n=1 Tax=Elysia marginata TaxID=1093978 RepID=A0AAV4G9G2_9GAST|nr:neuronal acetylcholine receptor subunit alpha-7 [Elysia marginata]